jgi:DNA-directed RNA polymerase omega subunit
MRKGNSRGTEVDIEKCVEAAGGNRYNLVLIGAERSREIKRQTSESMLRTMMVGTIVPALLEIQQGKVGVEYLNKIRAQRHA